MLRNRQSVRSKIKFNKNQGEIKMKKNFKIILSVRTLCTLLLVVLVAASVFTGCNDNGISNSKATSAPTEAATESSDEPTDTSESETTSEDETTPEDNPEDIGEGETTFLFKVTDGDGKVTSWNVSTDEKTVGAALVEVELIEGDAGEYGLMVIYVNGIRADFNEDGAWWKFQIDGEDSMVGVDSTDIEEGVTYAFIHTPA